MLSVFRNIRNEKIVFPNLLLVIGLLLFPIIISAQSFSGVTGIVTDQGGAVVPGVKVTLLDTKTSREVITTTNDQGVYAFGNIAPGGGYKLTFAGQGFQTFVLNDVQLGVGKTETQNIQLTAGQISEVVQVTSTTGDATLNTTDASIGNVIGSRQLRELPIQLRGSPAALIGLQPGAVGNNVGAGGGNRTGSVTGSRADQGNITVDGIDANDVTTGQAFNTVANAPIDSIQEFRAVTSGPNASEGRSSGGQIQLTTNSGTNDLHGSLREYYRTDKTAANDFFNNRNNVARPKLRRHQFGGSIGGPLPIFNFGEGGPMFISGKDKVFFFFDYEARRDDSQTTTTRTVPLQHFRNGQLGYIRATDSVTGAACGSASRLDTTPNCIGFLTTAQIAALDPKGVGVNTALLNFINNRYPLANDLTGGNGINTGLYRFNAPNVREDNIYTGRIDVNPTPNQKIFGRMTITRRDSTNALQQFPGDEDAVTFKDKSYAIAGGHTWVINPSLTNVATVGLSKSANFFSPPTIPSFPNSFGAGGVLTAPFPSLSYQDRNVFVPTIRDDLTWNTGSHSFQFGGSFKPIRQKPSLINDFNFVTLGIGGNTTQLNANLRPSTLNAAGVNILNATGALTNYDAAYAYILGRYASISTNFVYDPAGVASAPGSGRKRSYAYNEYEFYAQDNWRVRSDLTLNLGVRYHYYPPPYEVNGFQGSQNVDFQEMLAARIRNAANGVAGATSEPLLSFDLSGKANDRPDLYRADKNNFAPRLGFSYNPSFEKGILGFLMGQRKTVIRGNASLVFDRVGGAITFIQDQSNFVFDSNSATVFGSTDATASLLNDPRFTSLNALPIQNVAPSVARPSTPNVVGGIPVGTRTSQTSFLVAKDFEIPYSYTFNFGMQRELPGNMILDVSYVGRLGRKLFTQADSAQVLNFKDAASGQFMLDAFNAIQRELQAGVAPTAVTNQPWIENQNGLARASTPTYCATRSQGSCTRQLAAVFTTLLRNGGTGDLVQQMYANNLLVPNVGISSQFATNRFITNQGSSSYHGALISLQKRFSKGFEFDLNYTFSHSVDNQSSIVNTVSGGLLCDAINVNACRGDSDFDIRHLANANGIWDLPVGRGRWLGRNANKWVDFFVGGWTLSGILGARSGLAINSGSGVFPVSFLVNSPAIQTGNESAFKPNIRDEAGGIQFFADPVAAQAALRYPKHGEIGSRNIFRSPMFWNLDMGLSKKFKAPWSESHKFSFRVDAFNVTNTNSFSVPSLAYNTTTFGRITTSLSSPRELQFALRYDF